MNIKGNYTTTDYIPFDEATKVAYQQIEEGNKIFGLYIIVAINTGLRVSDLQKITWEQLRSETFRINEGKTDKTRLVKPNQHIIKAVQMVDNWQTGSVFISKKKTVYTNSAINMLLKTAFSNSRKKTNISSHSLRKSFGRRVYESQGESEKALIYLQSIFNHESSLVTRIYLGIRQEELNNVTDNL